MLRKIHLFPWVFWCLFDFRKQACFERCFFLVFGFRVFFRRFSAGSKQTGGSHMIQCKRTSFWNNIDFSLVFPWLQCCASYCSQDFNGRAPCKIRTCRPWVYIYMYIFNFTFTLHICIYTYIYIYCMCIYIYVHMLHLFIYLYIITFISNNNDRYRVRWQEATPSIWIISSNRFSAKNSKWKGEHFRGRTTPFVPRMLWGNPNCENLSQRRGKQTWKKRCLDVWTLCLNVSGALAHLAEDFPKCIGYRLFRAEICYGASYESFRLCLAGQAWFLHCGPWDGFLIQNVAKFQ